MNSVSNILSRPFSQLSLTEKTEIKTLGRPTPHLNLEQLGQYKGREYRRRFQPGVYTEHEWLCGCDARNAFFCFPCILFGHDLTWTKTGVTDLKHLKEKIKKHECSSQHINSCMELAVLGKVNIVTQLDSAYRQSINKHNDQVRKNRHILRRIIQCIKFCGVFEVALRGHDESDSSLNPGIFKGLINFTAEIDVAMKEHLSTASVFKGTSKTIQNELLDCMLNVCREQILSEIRESQFVAIEADETTDVSNKCQMVLVFRYELGGHVYERFWGFINPTDRTAEGLSQSLLKQINPILSDTPHKLICQGFDGASVMSGRTGGVQAKLKEHYPNAHFIHCYGHQLNLTMQKACSYNPQVKLFFCNLSAIPTFFSNSSHRSDLLNEIVKTRLPRTITTRWNYNIRTVNVVYENRDKLIECFCTIEEEAKSSISVNEASGLRRALEDPTFMFWLTVFHKLMPHVDILYKQLQKREIDSVQIKKAISDFTKCLSQQRDEIDSISYDLAGYSNCDKRRRLTDTRTIAAKEVCDVVMNQVHDRFAFTGHIEAATLLYSDSFEKFSTIFPESTLCSTVLHYPMLHKERLKTELEVIYKRPDFRQVKGALPLLTFILENNLKSTFKETLKLLRIIVTTPMSTAEAERCFSTLARIKTFLRNTMTEERLSALAMLSIAKDLIYDMPDFDDKVIAKFVALRHRRVEFMFK